MTSETEESVVKFNTAEFIGNEKIVAKNDKKVVVNKLPKGPVMTLPKYIHLTTELAWAIGFFIAEGNKTYSGIGIANREIALIKKFKRAIERTFKISSKKWRAYIRTPDKNLKKIREKWSGILRIYHIKAYFTGLARQDVVEIRINNTLFSKIFWMFVRKAMSEIVRKENLMINFLDGYEVGDGSVLQRNGYLYGIVITVKDRNMKNYLSELFKQLYGFSPRIRKSKGSYEIQVCGVHKMTQLILDGHFMSSRRQWKKLVSCYSKKQYVRSHVRYWMVISDGFLSINEIADKVKRSHWSVRDALNRDVKLGLVSMERKQIMGTKAPYFKFYSLSNEGQQLIKILKENVFHGKKGFDTGSGGT
jgi:predicted transcriptional regulator